ncbi:uncharacterized protein FTOL_12190 [Fusarium torulosum]|uniref:Uncharacterized protein n=1 Tax=Fusarium torulosum TaxID=33205 RepID=A0AAE8MK54_9HYPO|nr:uncharacterized protein FTOL_12190 [Fusarium torulosum]
MSDSESTIAQPTPGEAAGQGQGELSTTKKAGLTTAMTSSQLVQMVPFGAGIAVTLPIAHDVKLHRDVAT